MSLSRASRALSCIGNRVQSCCVPHLCEIKRDDYSPASSSANRHPHRVPFAVTVLLVIIAAVCALGLIMRFSPPALARLASVFRRWSEATRPRPVRGVRAGTIQISDLPTATAPPDDRNASGAEAAVVSSLAEEIGGAMVGSGRRTQTSGVHAASDDPPGSRPSGHLALSIAKDTFRAACTRATSSIDCPGCERCLGSASNARPSTSRGVALNPVQDEHPSPPSPTIHAQETIIKSLFPGRDSAGQHLDPVPHSPLTHASHELLDEPINGTPTAAAGGAAVFMLAVAAGADKLEDPEVDHDFVVQVFRSAAICLVSLLDDQATRASIRGEFRAMYRRAQQNSVSQMLVILMGLGDPSGDMCLSGGTTIGAQDFQDWIGELQTESPHPRPKFGIIFDICRRDVTRSNHELDHDLAIVWSCSAGQWAYALRFGPGLPSSCFLVSLFLAAHDSLVESTDFEHAFKYRLAQQGDLLRFIHGRNHEGNKTCPKCVEPGRCNLPELQKLDRGETGRDTLYAIGELIKSEFPGVARRVHAEMAEKMERWGFSGSGIQT